MKVNKNKMFMIVIVILSILTVFLILLFYVSSKSSKQEEDFKYYTKLSRYVMPERAMNEILKLDIKSHEEGHNINFTTMASILAAKYYGDWKEYSDQDLNMLFEKLKYKETQEELKQLYSNYEYFYEFYNAIFSSFVGKYKISQEIKDNDEVMFSEKYGLKAYFPIAYGYDVNFNNNFDNEINLAKKNGHFGVDLLIKTDNTPVIAVESGIVSKCDDNSLVDQIEITSFDGKRTYIYGNDNERKNLAVNSVKKDDIVIAGEIIGFFQKKDFEKTGSLNSDVNCGGLHFGLRLSMEDDELKDKEIYVNTYNILKLLEHHKSEVVLTKKGKWRCKYIVDDADESIKKHNKKTR